MDVAAPQEKPSVAETLAWLDAEVWPKLNNDPRTPDQIIGHDAHGLKEWGRHKDAACGKVPKTGEKYFSPPLLTISVHNEEANG